MAYPRRRTYRKKTNTYAKRKRYNYRASTKAKAVGFRKKCDIHHFKATCQLTNLSTGTVASTGDGYYLSWNLNNFVAPSNIANMINSFDYYKWGKCVIRLVPTYTGNLLQSAVEPTGGTNANYFRQCVHSAIDYNNTTAPTDVLGIMGSPTYRRTHSNRDHVRTVYPKAPLSLNSGTGVAAARYNGWISTDDPALYFNGLKVWFDAVANVALEAPGAVYQVYLDAHVMFRNPTIRTD